MTTAPRTRTRTPWAASRGLSVVELMVGLAVGMFIAAAALLSSVNLTESTRRVLLEARLCAGIAGLCTCGAAAAFGLCGSWVEGSWTILGR